MVEFFGVVFLFIRGFFVIVVGKVYFLGFDFRFF